MPGEYSKRLTTLDCLKGIYFYMKQEHIDRIDRIMQLTNLPPDVMQTWEELRKMGSDKAYQERLEKTLENRPRKSSGYAANH